MQAAVLAAATTAHHFCNIRRPKRLTNTYVVERIACPQELRQLLYAIATSDDEQHKQDIPESGQVFTSGVREVPRIKQRRVPWVARSQPHAAAAPIIYQTGCNPLSQADHGHLTTMQKGRPEESSMCRLPLQRPTSTSPPCDIPL